MQHCANYALLLKTLCIAKLLAYIDKQLTHAEIVAVIADDRATQRLEEASKRAIATMVASPSRFADTAAFITHINGALDKLNPDVIVLDGFAYRALLRQTANRLVTDRADVLLERASQG